MTRKIMGASRVDVDGTLCDLFRHNAAILRELLEEQPSLAHDKRGAIAFAAQVLGELADLADDLKNKQKE